MYKLAIAEMFGIQNGLHLSLANICEEPESTKLKQEMLSGLKKELVSKEVVQEKIEYMFLKQNKGGKDGQVI